MISGHSIKNISVFKYISVLGKRFNWKICLQHCLLCSIISYSKSMTVYYDKRYAQTKCVHNIQYVKPFIQRHSYVCLVYRNSLG